VTPQALDPLPCHKLSQLLGPDSHSKLTYFMDGPLEIPTYKQKAHGGVPIHAYG